jgi:hypothetical protein
VIYIDLAADLNLEDGERRNIGRLTDAVAPGALTRHEHIVLRVSEQGTALGDFLLVSGGRVAPTNVCLTWQYTGLKPHRACGRR